MLESIVARLCVLMGHRFYRGASLDSKHALESWTFYAAKVIDSNMTH